MTSQKNNGRIGRGISPRICCRSAAEPYSRIQLSVSLFSVLFSGPSYFIVRLRNKHFKLSRSLQPIRSQLSFKPLLKYQLVCGAPSYQWHKVIVIFLS